MYQNGRIVGIKGLEKSEDSSPQIQSFSNIGWICSGDLMCSIVIIDNNTELYTWKLCKVVDAVISLIVVIILQYLCISEQHAFTLQTYNLYLSIILQ